MPSYSTKDIRNLALVGHAGAGKTALADALLWRAGGTGSLGSTDNGDSLSDFTDEEKHHGHSLTPSILHADHEGVHVNLIDTPGSTDFLGGAVASLPAVETVAVVISAQAGIESVTRRMMRIAGERHLCRMIIINKIDAENIDLAAVVEQVQTTFGKVCLPINLPAEGGTTVVDCFTQTEGDSDLGPVAEWHTKIIEQVVEVDEDLMAVYLEQGDVKPDQLHEPFEKALREGHLIPVSFAAARPHTGGDPVGVRELLKKIEKFGPSPLEGNPRPFVRGDDYDHEIHPEPDPDKHVLAHVFNIRVDPFVGKLAAFRVHQGTVTPQSQLYIGDPKEGESKKPVKVGHLFKLQGGKHVEIDAAIPGDIAAVAKVDEIHRDAVLHDSHDEDLIHLLPLKLPEPMTGLAITPTKRGDEQKIGDALTKLQEEDPSFTVTRDASTHETVIHGLGELHLRVMLEKLKDRYHIEVDTAPPKIAYRETVQATAEAQYRHKKQTGGAGQFAEVQLRVEPNERGAGFEFVDAIVGGAIPNQFIPAVEKGLRQAIAAGPIAGCPVQDVKVTLFDGKHHPVDSKEIAFITAAKRAFAEAFRNAKPVLLEPMVEIEVTTPNAHMGDITGDLSGKRGRINGTDMLPGDQALITAVVPLSEVSSYGSQLKSVTGGQGSYALEMSHYDAVPAHVQEKVAAEYKPREEED